MHPSLPEAATGSVVGSIVEVGLDDDDVLVGDAGSKVVCTLLTPRYCVLINVSLRKAEIKIKINSSMLGLIIRWYVCMYVQ